jgi:hypothetical protein
MEGVRFVPSPRQLERGSNGTLLEVGRRERRTNSSPGVVDLMPAAVDDQRCPQSGISTILAMACPPW